MAASETTSVDSEPNFAVICSFMQEHGDILGIPNISFNALQNYLEETRCVRRPLEELFLKLLRRWKSCSADKWEKYLTKYAYTYSQVDAWELERLGFPRCKLSTKLRLLKNLLETQFDRNAKFKEKINEKHANVLRVLPIGRDKNSLAYWFLLDNDLNVRVYREDPDDVECETWEMVVSNRNDLANLISGLESGFDVKAEEKSRSTTPSAISSDQGKDDGETVKSEDKPMSGLVKEESDVTADKSNDVKSEASVKSEDTQVESDLKTEDVKCHIQVKKEPPDPPDETCKCPTPKEIDDIKSEIKSEPESNHESGVSQVSKCHTPAGDNAEASAYETKSHKESNDRPKIHEAADLEPIAVKTDDKEKRCEENKISVEQKLTADKNKDAENLNKAKNDEVATHTDIEDDAVRDKPNEIDNGPIQEKTDNLEESKCSKEKVDSKSHKSSIASEDRHPEHLEDSKIEKECNKPGRCLVPENNEGKESTSLPEKSSVVEKKKISNRKPIKLTISNGKLKTSESTEDSKSEHEEESSENNEKVAGELATSTENVKTHENKEGKDLDNVNTKNDKETADREIGESDAGTKRKTRLTRRGLKQAKKTGTEEEETPRQRKRRRCSSQNEQKEEKSESEISETHSESDTATDTEVPPTKKHRDWQRKKVRSKRRKKEPEPEDSDEETLDNLKKKQSRSDECDEKGEPEGQESGQKDGENQKASTETESEGQTKKKRGRGRAKREKAVKDVSEEPSTKKGRRQGSGHLKKKLEPEADFDTDDSIPLIQLRRSSRSTRGQRHFDAGIIPDSPVTKKKGEKKQDKKEEKKKRGRPKKEEETPKGKDKKQRKRRQTKAEKEEELAKSRKMIEMKDDYETDEEFVPGQEKKKNKKKKGKKRRPKPKEDGTDYEDALFQQAVDDLHEIEDSPSLHWSSSSTEIEPESDGSEYQPRGRNINRAMARKNSVEGSAPTKQDKPCSKCEKYNHPELILLCDLCDAGYHTACLRPPLMIIPDGDWYCPTCEHGFLIKKLQEKLEMLTHKIKDKDRVKNMRARLDYVNISLANVIHTKEEVEDDQEYWRNRERRKKKDRQKSEGRSYRPDYWESEDSETEDESESETESSSSEEEEVIRRSHRQRKEISYKFEEFDEMIFTAIEDEIKNAPEKPPPPPKPKGQSTGKDMSNILGISPEKDENEEEGEEGEEGEDDDDKGDEDGDKLDERRKEMKHRPSPVLKRKAKKGRKLTALDSGDDVGDDDSEEYKASEDSPGSDASFEPENLSDGSEEWLGRGSRRSKRHRGRGRKSSRRRGRRRDLGDFIVEGEDDSDCGEKPTRRTGRSAGRRAVSYREEPSSDEYNSEASGYHKKKKRPSSKSDKKKRRRLVFSDDSEREQDDDNEISESDDDGPRHQSRRAAAKKVNYREMADQDSEDSDAPKKKMAVSNFIKSDEGSATDNYYDDDGNSKDDKDSDESDSQSTAATDRTGSQSDTTQQTANRKEKSPCDKPAQKVSNSENCNINGGLESHTPTPSGQDSKTSGVKLLPQNRTIDQNGGPKVTSAKSDPNLGSIENEANAGSEDSDIDDQLFEEDEEDLESVAELVELVSKQ